MKKRYYEKFVYIFWVFMLGSFLGFIHENLLMAYRGRDVLRQGLIYEPLIPVYGFGLMCFCILFSKFKIDKRLSLKHLFLAFIFSFLLGGVVEYLFSFLQEVIFGTISWDYSGYAHNLLGRTSLYHCTIWGLMGLTFYILLYPLILKIKNYVDRKWLWKLTILFSIFLLLDCSISIAACLRQSERREGIPANGQLDYFLDEHYPDELLEHIFNNARVPKSKK